MPASQVETSTADTFLMHKVTTSSGSSYVKLVCIKDYPDIGGTPESIDVTDLCDHAQRFIEGIESGEQLEFTCNYTAERYSAILALKGRMLDLALYLGADASGEPDGHDGMFKFKGQVSARFSGKGVNEAREFVLIVTPNSKPDFSVPTPPNESGEN